MPLRGRRRDRRLILATRARATQNRYLKAVLHFVMWCESVGENFDNTVDLDEVLCDYFHYVLDEGLGKTRARCAFYGLLMLLPEFKGKFPVSAAALKGFEAMCPSISYPPITWELTALVAMQLVNQGNYDEAVAVVLAFECLFRISEVVAIRVRDVADSADPRIGSFFNKMAIRLPKTKTGPNKWAEVTSAPVMALLRAFIRGKAAADLVFGFSAARLRHVFTTACHSVGLSAPYVFHSLRHGGATHRFMLGANLEDILRLGRWACAKSARLYIQSGRSLLLNLSVSPLVSAQARMCAPIIISYLTSLAQ